ncbi:glycosyl transferase family 2 [Loktanella sp. PT4BL]|jgi:glycosyltransferase involved in cell wall biosynthesis|uniref:glycosyltransferase n=1 Tax=Loktanella sp. PT4BL TaxID=2135611 RepID=UPI000D7752C3|nr:glycosyltransferase [Loktanella sp. PT4BL]PXW72252.1 glycosyl transferase family 2 [Loktanella sp. PT4BL]
MLTVIIPSYNEEIRIASCIDAIAAQSGLPNGHAIQVIVAANGCHDRTVQRANERAAALREKGFDLVVLDIAQGNKMNALNEAEKVAAYDTRVYLDADVILSNTVLVELTDILSAEEPRYASGTVRIPRPTSIISRAYAKVWTNLPFVRDGVPGIGLYATNANGRARWDEFPAIYSDDRFVRLQFAPHERFKTQATYEWPLPEGFSNLVHVRHRWSEGNMELAEKYPELMKNDSQRNKTASNILSLFAAPFSSAIFVLVFFVSNVRASRTKNGDTFIWRRGRD